MPFTDFGIPGEEPKKVQGGKFQCNARVRLNGVEGYCETLSDDSKRCNEHNVGVKKRIAREEARLATIVDSGTVAERAAELAKDKRNLTRLDELVYNSLATIQELEKRFPLSTVSPSEAVTIAGLREKHAALAHKRVELESKLKTLLDTDFIFEEAARLFEEKVTDTNTRKILLVGIGETLNKIVASGGAQESTDSPN